MNVVNQEPVANRLLAALSRKEFAHLLACLDPVQVSLGEVLHEPGELIRHIYFPNDCLISLRAVVEGRMTLEVDLVGREGMVGVPVVLGGSISQVRAVVQRAGSVMRIRSAHFRDEFVQHPSLQRELYHYTNATMVQSIQTAVCSRYHLLEARLARSLLMTRDRLQSGEFHVTHETLAHALGVRRVGVTKAASELQRQKLISYSRGDVTIQDDKGLEAVSCRCYQIVKDMAGGK